jgi:hypothetical protein
MRFVSLLLLTLALTACDKLTGAADQKIADAEAVGFGCRVSGKAPEACMKENEAQSPSSLLDGWKAADEDIKSGKLDPTMSNTASSKDAEAKAAEGDAKPEGDAKAEPKKDGEPAADPKKDGKAADEKAKDAKGKDEKPKEDKVDPAAKADAKH